MKINSLYSYLKKKISNNKNQEQKTFELLVLIKSILTNKEKLAVIMIFIYLFGLVYQFMKIVWVDRKPQFSYLIFFSFSNTINDFLIIVWNIFWYFILTFSLIYITILTISWYKFKNAFSNKIYWILHSLILLIIISIFSYKNLNLKSFDSVIKIFITVIPYLLWVFLSYVIFTWKKWKESTLYLFFLTYFFYWFILLLVWWEKYYACEKLRDNDPIKNCFILTYKNDKYWFTWNWDVYKLDEFKSFFTADYIKNKTQTWGTK
ncbi:MAG: hypothetical protein ACD_2C00035G0002 [uncultured bacterium (gcode 4)]|uniref:Uncharacterized protein n=1 Tax=uncultured bacterium (gcode 4) TaxID=1234023 RepID=K2G4K3_9BACT|nr:MAG: hypothetical protein ACD_2C00035G0002 [uncultured bacterium (gcode 4)]